MPHLRRYQGFAVENYSVTLDALYLGHPRLSLNRGITIWSEANSSIYNLAENYRERK